jgi:hypothetical protein
MCQTAVYKEFGRPFAKVFLMAVFTYQGLYYLWLRLEKDEEKRAKNGTLSEHGVEDGGYVG